MQGHVLVAGSANIDLVARVPRLPAPGQTILADSFEMLPGGKGANQAVAAARAGAAVTFFGCVGQDTFGDKLLNVLTAAGVDVSAVERPELPTGTALISVDADGQNLISIFPGANSALRFSESFRRAVAADVLLAQNECPLEVVLEYFKAARQQRVTTILNAAPVVQLPAGLLELVDVLVVNEEEAREYAGVDARVGEIERLAERLQTRSDQTILITLGADGVLGLASGQMIRLPGHPVKPVDTTGAGDCFCGYLAACLASGRSVREAMMLANAAAALAVQRPGAALAMPPMTEVLEFARTAT